MRIAAIEGANLTLPVNHRPTLIPIRQLAAVVESIQSI
jgi:hypothetical protein